MVCWFVHLLVCWVVGWLVVWLVGWLVVWFVGCLVGCLAGHDLAKWYLCWVDLLAGRVEGERWFAD